MFFVCILQKHCNVPNNEDNFDFEGDQYLWPSCVVLKLFLMILRFQDASKPTLPWTPEIALYCRHSCNFIKEAFLNLVRQLGKEVQKPTNVYNVLLSYIPKKIGQHVIWSSFKELWHFPTLKRLATECPASRLVLDVHGKVLE